MPKTLPSCTTCGRPTTRVNKVCVVCTLKAEAIAAPKSGIPFYVSHYYADADLPQGFQYDPTKVRRVRISCGYDMAKSAAEAIGCNYPDYIGMEVGWHNPYRMDGTPRTLTRKIAKLFGWSIYELFGEPLILDKSRAEPDEAVSEYLMSRSLTADEIENSVDAAAMLNSLEDKRLFAVMSSLCLQGNTFREVAEELGMSHQRVHQLYARACERMRQLSKQKDDE